MAKKQSVKSAKRQSKKLPLLRTHKSKLTRGFNLQVTRQLQLVIKLKRYKLKKTPSRRRRIASAAAIITIGLSGAIYFGLNAFMAPASLPPAYYSPPAIKTSNEPPSAGVSAPKSLVIPDIGVAAPLVTVGRQADGTLGVPGRFDVGGWYRNSPVPGDIGPSVIVGHVDSTTGPAVFWRLSELKPGQLIVVKRSDGKMVRFKVTAVRQFSQDRFPTRQVYGDIDHSGLRLITCGGIFDRSIRQYSHNTVVYATMVI